MCVPFCVFVYVCVCMLCGGQWARGCRAAGGGRQGGVVGQAARGRLRLRLLAVPCALHAVPSARRFTATLRVPRRAVRAVQDKLKELVQRYSEFISFPIYLLTEKSVEKEVRCLRPAELCYIALRCVALHCFASHCIALQGFKLHGASRGLGTMDNASVFRMPRDYSGRTVSARLEKKVGAGPTIWRCAAAWIRGCVSAIAKTRATSSLWQWRPRSARPRAQQAQQAEEGNCPARRAWVQRCSPPSLSPRPSPRD